MITGRVDQAYCNMMAEEHNSFRYQLIQKAGFLITTDGSVDDRVQPEDVKNYQVPPPATIDPLSTNPVTKPVESGCSETLIMKLMRKSNLIKRRT